MKTYTDGITVISARNESAARRKLEKRIGGACGDLREITDESAIRAEEAERGERDHNIMINRFSEDRARK